MPQIHFIFYISNRIYINTEVEVHGNNKGFAKESKDEQSGKRIEYGEQQEQDPDIWGNWIYRTVYGEGKHLFGSSHLCLYPSSQFPNSFF